MPGIHSNFCILYLKLTILYQMHGVELYTIASSMSAKSNRFRSASEPALSLRVNCASLMRERRRNSEVGYEVGRDNLAHWIGAWSSEEVKDCPAQRDAKYGRSKWSFSSVILCRRSHCYESNYRLMNSISLQRCFLYILESRVPFLHFLYGEYGVSYYLSPFQCISTI